MSDYDIGFRDALRWVIEHTNGDNYQLQVIDKLKQLKQK